MIPHACPKCGNKHHIVNDVQEEDELYIEYLTCKECKYDWYQKFKKITTLELIKQGGYR